MARPSSPSHQDHRREAESLGPIAIAVLTISDTRDRESDASGAFLRERIEAEGHTLADYRIVRDDAFAITATLTELAGGSAEVIIANGGTGIAKRDSTFEAIGGALEKTLPGFGELFRILSYEEIGPAAMLSRATAGLFGASIVFSLPGSPAAVRLAWEKLIGPEIRHVVRELRR